MTGRPEKKKKWRVISDDTIVTQSENDVDESSNVLTKEIFARNDPGPDYPTAMPPAVAGATEESTVFSLMRRPIRFVSKSIKVVGAKMRTIDWKNGRPVAAGFGAYQWEKCFKYTEASINHEKREAVLQSHGSDGGLGIKQKTSKGMKPMLSQYADFLRPLNCHQFPPFMAGLLGFDSVNSMHPFLDQDGK